MKITNEVKNLPAGQLASYDAPNAPHLHFAVFRLGPERQWWERPRSICTPRYRACPESARKTAMLQGDKRIQRNREPA
ncbi:hypothetical protein AX767_18295 [Variovorax sp. PAMC 28711]|nr:hypothetical protein AX767_18295 [Variovorax sp. PAMC 28711]